MSAVPVLDTERLVLREHREDDLADYAALWSDHEVVRFITGKPLDRAECWTRILRFRGMWAVIGYGFWIIEHRQSGKVIGEAGIMDAKRDMTPSLDGTLEAGWALHPSTHGRGLAREAMTAVLGWADAHHPETPQSCIISEGNTASISLADRLGFRETARGPHLGSMVLHFRRRPHF
jgi:RimJ/RimL family protein N-acetyltransferase